MNGNPYGLASLWAQGDLVTRGVALALLLMSLTSWYVILTRAVRAVRLRRSARLAVQGQDPDAFAARVATLGALAPDDLFRELAAEGRRALERHTRGGDLARHVGLAPWLTESLRGALDDATEVLQRGLPVLASIGSTAPFVGLFGTVWGIYHALVRIGASGQASIDKVAGPVGEALIMTAFGLAVAIPAVLGYNALTRSNRALLRALERFARGLHAHLLTRAGARPAEG